MNKDPFGRREKHSPSSGMNFNIPAGQIKAAESWIARVCTEDEGMETPDSL